jgi:hypothetical protein
MVQSGVFLNVSNTQSCTGIQIVKTCTLSSF